MPVGPVDDEWLDATELAALLKSKEIGPAEILQSAIERAERLNPYLNAVIHPLFDKARASVPEGGPFSGVPILLKDIGATSAGDPYHEGTTFLQDAHWRATEDSYVVRRLRQAGFVVIGKTNVPELGVSPTTEPEAYGPTHNPWHLDRSPGGSSGGSAAAVASGMVAVAHGNDGGGSIRIPAAMCGLVGLKPSRGRIPWGPAPELPGGFAVQSVLTRTVRDTAALLDVLRGRAPGELHDAEGPSSPYSGFAATKPERLRIRISTAVLAGYGGPDLEVAAEIRAAVEATGALLAELGHEVEPVGSSPLDDFELTEPMATMTFTTVSRALDAWGERLGRELGPHDVNADNWTMAELGHVITAPVYLAALETLHRFRVGVLNWWAEGFDVLLTPTVAAPPPVLGWLAPSRDAPLQGATRSMLYSVFTTPFNITGQPAISLPAASDSDGLPIGIQLVANQGREDHLLQLATQLEQAQPWDDRHPPLPF